MSEQENLRSAHAESEEISAPDSPTADAAIETQQDASLSESTAETVSPTQGDTDEGDRRVGELEETIARLQAENSELKNQYLRKQADFENYRKRMARDKEDAVNFANQQLLLDLTSVIDDFERAIKSADESRDYDAFHNGVVLIEKQLTSMLERKWGLRRFDSEGEVFDPQKHEAVTTEPRDDHEQSAVLEDYQKGYMLHDRVLRSAKVKVSMPTKADA